MEPSSNPSSESDKDRFIQPIGRYRGEFSPQELAFNVNLQEFANRVAIICALETGGKISSLDAYKQIKSLWKELRSSKENLLDTPPPEVELPPES